MVDRAFQAVHLLTLAPIAETIGDLNSYGFREKRSAMDALTQLFNVLVRKNSAQWILEGDIMACFDELCHQWLLEQIPVDKRSLRQWLTAGYIEKEALHPTEKGSPQGGIISPAIANMALDGWTLFSKKPFHLGSVTRFI